VHLVAEGSGFLRHMVRNLAGTLIEVGLGRREPESMGALLAGRSRAAAGPTAPAAGLTLEHVEYADPATPGR
jgi:tRNA pseudouridine38-40 synthase